MAIISKDDILNKLKDRIGDDTSDEALQFIEDVADTYNDLESRSKDQTDWEKKYKENDDAWRKKYKERFFAPSKDDSDPGPESDDEDDQNKHLSYNDLFKIEK